MADLYIHTTLTLDSAKLQFGPPGAIDYRSHPGASERDDPTVVFEVMKNTGAKQVEDISIMRSTIYSYRNRKIMTRWLGDVCAVFALKITTMCLSVQLTDAFLLGNLNTLDIDSCQLAAVTCLWIAAKFEEMDSDLPKLRKIVDVCNGAYTSIAILDMEERILSFFKWCLPHTTVVNHFYLQVHLLNSPTLVQHHELAAKYLIKESVQISLLLLGPNNQRVWKDVMIAAESKLADVLPRLCANFLIRYSLPMNVFQLFGTDLLLAQRVELSILVKDLPGDQDGQVRLYLFPTNNHFRPIFVEHEGYVFLRSINYYFLDLCDFLTQNVIVHVEFLRLPNYINALGILGLALCLLSTKGLIESKAAIQHIAKLLKLSLTRALASANLLCAKYREALETTQDSLTLVRPPADIQARLAFCFDRELPSTTVESPK